MSRAFVKEPDGDQVPDDQPELPVSPHPNYVTPEGLAALHAAAAERRRALAGLEGRGDDVARRTEAARLGRELRYYEARVASAIEVEPRPAAAERVTFGSTVTFADPTGATLRYRIVGEDQADPAAGLVSYRSPLARAALGAAPGDRIRWERPEGTVELEVLEVCP